MARNPMLEQLNPVKAAQEAMLPTDNNPIAQIKNLYQAYQMAQNPAAMLQQMAAQNPMINELTQISRGGGNLQQAFYTLCQKKGVDPQTILSQLN